MVVVCGELKRPTATGAVCNRKRQGFAARPFRRQTRIPGAWSHRAGLLRRETSCPILRQTVSLIRIAHYRTSLLAEAPAALLFYRALKKLKAMKVIITGA